MAKKKPKDWIKTALDPAKKGTLHKALGIPPDQKIPPAKLAKAAAKGGLIGKRAKAAQTLEGLSKKGNSGK